MKIHKLYIYVCLQKEKKWGDIMTGFSFWEMVETIANLVLSTPIFLITLILGIVLLTAMIVSIKYNKKLNKILTVVVYTFLFLFIIIYYNSYLYNLLDNFMNTIFTQIFFPNLATYLIMLVTTIIILFYSILKTEMQKYLKIINMIVSFIIIFLFVLTLNLIVAEGINIYEVLTVYSNKTLLILIEFDMIIFTLWILLLLSIKVIKKLIKKSNDKIVRNFLQNSKDDIETLKL